VLRQLPKQVSDKVLVGLETPDDAGVYVLNGEFALIQTLDFFTPIVDDPYDYGQIAAANSLSDVYAMGGDPITAMNIVCFPMGVIDAEVLVAILRGGADKVAESGAVLLGGHTVADETIKFGLSVTGLAHAGAITAIRGALPGDHLVLTKPLGTGIVTTALKRGLATPAQVEAVTRAMKALNRPGQQAMARVGIGTAVHAATDITGFSLLGHLQEVLAASGVSAEVSAAALPLLPGALEHAAAGVNTGGGIANAEFLAPHVHLAESVPEAMRVVCFDPQTSGGLLIAVAPERSSELCAALEQAGALCQALIGTVTEGAPGTIRVA
jgi:selenide,water dikinase